MELRIIRNLNKGLNCFSIITLLFGTVSILWTAQIASEFWAAITLSLLTIGLISLFISWIIIQWKSVKIYESEIEMLTINSALDLNKIKNHNEIQYLGNLVKLNNGIIYEIDRTQIMELINKLDFNKVQTKEVKQRLYSLSPKELLKILINLGP